ncbi:MAG: hypothetical protein ACW98X_07430 [Promethearchaeota archaeon]|jgi:hypothetical protein
MSSKSVDKKHMKIEYTEERILDLKNIITPFSRLILNKEQFIYDGNERIPFHKRDPLYQSTLLHEFGESVRNKD